MNMHAPTIALAGLAAAAVVLASAGCVEPYPNRLPRFGAGAAPAPALPGDDAVNIPPQPPPPVQGTFTGTLRGGIMAIGGETTGWMLEGPGDEPGRGMDVDISQATESAHALEGQPVAIRGHVQERRYVERGLVPVLIAYSISPQEQ